MTAWVTAIQPVWSCPLPVFSLDRVLSGVQAVLYMGGLIGMEWMVTVRCALVIGLCARNDRMPSYGVSLSVIFDKDPGSGGADGSRCRLTDRAADSVHWIAIAAYSR